MNILRSETFSCVLTILTSFMNVRMCDSVEKTDEATEVVSGDFGNFLNSLGSMVYKFKKPIQPEGGRQRPNEYSFATSHATTPPSPMEVQSIFKTQKAVLRDVLMMKLVSYYESKYIITDHSTTTDSVRRENNTKSNEANALNEMKRTEQTTRTHGYSESDVVELPIERARSRSNMESRVVEYPTEEEVIAI